MRRCSELGHPSILRQTGESGSRSIIIIIVGAVSFLVVPDQVVVPSRYHVRELFAAPGLSPSPSPRALSPLLPPTGTSSSPTDPYSLLSL
jgi:hypothetical protein